MPPEPKVGKKRSPDRLSGQKQRRAFQSSAAARRPQYYQDCARGVLTSLSNLLVFKRLFLTIGPINRLKAALPKLVPPVLFKNRFAPGLRIQQPGRHLPFRRALLRFRCHVHPPGPAWR